MAVETIVVDSSDATLLNFSPVGGTYSDARDATTAGSKSGPPQASFSVKQHYQTGPPIYYSVWRNWLPFDVSGLSAATVVLSAVVRLYGQTDRSDDEFEVTIVDGPNTGGGALDYSDFDQFGSTSYGSKNTSTLSTAAWNEITVNAAGIAVINAALQTGTVYFGIRSGEDIDNNAPPADTLQEFVFQGSAGANPPELVLTTSNWPNDVYPDDVVFPLTGKIDLETYSIISGYMTGIDGDLSLLTDGDGNLDLAVANWITWTGTSEKVAYDNATSHVTVTTLESTTPITIAADLVTADPSIATTCTAVDTTVAGDAHFSTTAYASEKSSITDNEVVFSGVSAPSPADNEGDLYMDSTSGDFVIKTRDDGLAGTKTGILGDFSAM